MGIFSALFGGTKTKEVSNIPSYAKPSFQSLAGMITPLASQGTTATGNLASGALDATLRGDYLGAGNPYLQQMAEAISRQYGEALTGGLRQVDANAQRAGVPYSSRTAVVGGRVARLGAQDLADRIAGLYGNAYESERGRQTSLIPTGIQAGQMPMNQALSIASLMKGSGGQQIVNQPGILGGIGQIMGGAGSLGGWLWPKQQQQPQQPLNYVGGGWA
jgi:hypothetical protein